MKTRFSTLIFTGMVCFGLVRLATAVDAADKSAPASDNHKLLSPLAGDFDQVTQVHTGPGNSIVAHSTSHGRWILGGNFIQITSASSPGEKLKGERVLIYGYDPAISKYTLIDLESSNAAATTATGDYDSATKTFIFKGERSTAPGVSSPFRWELKIEDSGTLVQKILMGEGDGAREVVSVTSTPQRK